MKKNILFTLVALATMASSLAMPLTSAQSPQTGHNPKGLYRLQKFIYENGRTTVPRFSQYKYAADSVGLLVSCNASRTATQWSSMQVEIREPYPLLNTGEKPQGDDGHGTQVFNVDDRQFHFKWYNDKWPNMSQLNQFITEVYTKEGIEDEVAKAFDMLEGKGFDAGGATERKFSGWWVRIAAAANPDGSGNRTQVPVIWKAYSPKLSMVVNVANNGIVLGCSTTNTIKYENDSTIHEIGHRCDIHWLSDDCHTLTFVQENGQPLTEVWVKSGLPAKWQGVFCTDIPLYRDGTQCMRDAVAAAASAAGEGPLQTADKYIMEAIGKNVNIEVLSEGIMAIAMHLLINKQQYNDCKDFCQRQLKRINDYADAGHDHNFYSKLNNHLTEVFRAVATYRSGEHEKGRRLMDEHIAIVEEEIGKYQTVKLMENYVNLLYYCNFMMYNLAYDVLGTERTLMYLDVVTLMAPGMASKNKPMLLNCRANCYLMDGNKEEARKLWQQIKDLDAGFLKKQPDGNPLKKAFGE